MTDQRRSRTITLTKHEDDWTVFYCPFCKNAVYDEYEGPWVDTCEHVRWFIDWNGQLNILQRDEGTKDLQSAFEESEDEALFITSQDTTLPIAAMIIELVVTSRDKDDESYCAICLDADGRYTRDADGQYI